MMKRRTNQIPTLSREKQCCPRTIHPTVQRSATTLGLEDFSPDGSRTTRTSASREGRAAARSTSTAASRVKHMNFLMFLAKIVRRGISSWWPAVLPVEVDMQVSQMDMQTMYIICIYGYAYTYTYMNMAIKGDKLVKAVEMP